jgi:exopolysaccharide biosynthesis protein
MQQYGAYNATNLDGGTSSVMVVNGKLINNPIDGALRKQTRPIATTFIVTE